VFLLAPAIYSRRSSACTANTRARQRQIPALRVVLIALCRGQKRIFDLVWEHAKFDNVAWSRRISWRVSKLGCCNDVSVDVYVISTGKGVIALHQLLQFHQVALRNIPVASNDILLVCGNRYSGKKRHNNDNNHHFYQRKTAICFLAHFYLQFRLTEFPPRSSNPTGKYLVKTRGGRSTVCNGYHHLVRTRNGVGNIGIAQSLLAQAIS
jgi:hypothetical protein